MWRSLGYGRWTCSRIMPYHHMILLFRALFWAKLCCFCVLKIAFKRNGY